MAGVKIKDAPLVEQVAGTDKIPVSNGSGQPKTVSVEQIKNYAINGMASSEALSSTVSSHNASEKAHPHLVEKINSIEDSIEGILNILEEQGHVHAQTLDIDALPTICTFPMFRIEEKDPDATPDFIGQIWINKAGNTVYIATHCNSAAGYKAI